MYSFESFLNNENILLNKTENPSDFHSPVLLYNVTNGLRIFYIPLSAPPACKANEWQSFVLNCKNKHPNSIILWEDVWLAQQPLVIHRINVAIGRFKRYHARQLTIKTLTTDAYNTFMTLHHLQGHVHAKHTYGLFTPEGYCVAAAGFSAKRWMKYEAEPYFSSELVRFATESGSVCAGGFTKLIRHFLHNFPATGITTYADLDWYRGISYPKMGFKQHSWVTPQTYYADLEAKIRIPTKKFESYLAANQIRFSSDRFVPVCNSGSIKFIL